MTALGRFTLCDVMPWHEQGIYELFSDAETVRYLGLPRMISMDDARAAIERYRTSPTRWLAVAEKTEFLGLVGVEIKGHQATVVIAFNQSRGARGAGREFSVPFVKWLFSHGDIWRVWAYCHVDNKPVQRVLTRMGAVREGCLRRFEYFPNVSAEPQDVYVYAITRG